jgi:predicted ATPase/transcriptional regulator with XRE-family HTH domain
VEAQSSFGEWLRARRKALDLTQIELAERTGCAEDTIGRIEAGTRRPSRQVAALLAEALGVPAQSQADFVRFAREGSLAAGTGSGLGRLEIASDTPDAPASPGPPANLTAPTQPTRAHPAAWVPYLSSLPHPPTLLIGREDELATTTALVRSGHARLLTFTGPPGVGKTRLAIALGSSLVPLFPDGICFVPLAPLRDPDLLALTVSHALGLSDNSGPAAALLLDFLRHKRLLLVLDNFEHILGATDRVAEWLSRSAYLQVLVTSRSALHLRGERLFPVSTLPVPPRRRTTDEGRPTTDDSSQAHRRTIDNRQPERSDHVPAEAHIAYPSVALFVERAQAVDPQFELSGTNAPVVAELCRRMEGLPLAIELTAARSARLAPEIVLARLERRVDVVRSGPRDLPHHQRNLRATIEWSYDLLDEPARLLFERTSVFTGGATLDALEAVCNAHEDLEGGLDEALERLLQQSLMYRVTVEGEQDIQISSRFNMLEMLREYAGERLAERENRWAAGSGQRAVKRYHAEYYLAMAEAAELQKSADEQQRWLDRLERDHDNLRAAIQWAIDSGQMDMAAGLCGALSNFWNVRGYLSEGRSWLDRVLTPASGCPEAEISPHNLAKALNGAGVLARHQADYAQAASLHERSLAIFRELDDKQGIASALNNLGVDFHFMDQVDRAEELYLESLEVWRALGDKDGMSRPIHNLGLIAQSRDDDMLAIHFFRESLKIERASNNKGGIAVSVYNLGTQLMSTSAADAGEPEAWAEAEKCFTESLALARELGNKSLLALCLTKLGEIALEQGDEANLAEATALFEDSLAMQRELGDREAIAYTLTDLGHAELFRGDRAGARATFEESLRLSRTLETTGKVMLNLVALAVTTGADALASHSQEAAQQYARRAAQLYAVRAGHGPYLLPVKQRYYNATMSAVHALLPADELEALQARGRKMRLEDAAALAVRG